MSRLLLHQGLILNLAEKIAPGRRAYLAKHVAYERLKALTGQDFGYDAQAWKRWFKQGRGTDARHDLAYLSQTLPMCVNREALYLEGNVCCIVSVVDVETSDTKMQATVRHVPVLPVCYFRRIRRPDEDPVETWSMVCPWGEQWTIGKGWSELHVDDEYWDGSWDGGFRLLFNAELLHRFRNHDIAWLHDMFS